MTADVSNGIENMAPLQILVVRPTACPPPEIIRFLASAPCLKPVFAGELDATAMETMRHCHRYDAILLALPGTQGHVTCVSLRRAGLRIPILIAAQASEEADIVRGLAAGANDYIAIPYRPRELLARIHAQIRAHETSEHAVLRIGPYEFQPGARVLYDPAENRRIRLTDKEAGVLKFLYRASGVPVGRQALLREVWGYSEAASTHTVETHIYRLRRKIEPTPTSVRILVNEDGGYRLATQSSVRPQPHAHRIPPGAPAWDAGFVEMAAAF
jgi:DNA-binding response OmpR family regulator